MQGYKTLTTNAILGVFEMLELAFDTPIGVDDQTAAVAGLVALVNIILRFVTKTPVFEGK